MDIRAEISALERQLAEKKLEEKKLKSNLEEVESRIVSVRKKFDRQLARLADKREGLLSTRSEIQQESMHLEVERAALDRELAEADSLAQRMRSWNASVSLVSDLIQYVEKVLTYFRENQIYALATLSSNASDAAHNDDRTRLMQKVNAQTDLREQYNEDIVGMSKRLVLINEEIM